MFVVAFAQRAIDLKPFTPSPSTRLPVIDAAGFGNPGWDGNVKVAGKGMDVRLVHPAKLCEFLIDTPFLPKLQASFFEEGANMSQLIRRKAIVFGSMGRTVEDLGEVHNSVACDRKCQLGLTLTGAFQGDNSQCTGIQNRSKGSQPGLVIVVRTKISEHWIGEMTFE
jgi:hypothetical protein